MPGMVVGAVMTAHEGTRFRPAVRMRAAFRRGMKGGRRGDRPRSQEGGWADVLGVDEAATEEEVRAAYRAKMRRHHPDVAGDADVAVRLNAARDHLLVSVRRRRDGEGDGDGAGRAAPTRKGSWATVRFTPGNAAWRHYATIPSRRVDRAAFAADAARAAEAHRSRRETARARARQRDAEDAAVHRRAASVLPVVLVAGALFQALSGQRSAGNNDLAVGAPADGDCRAQGGGLCRFL